MATTKGQIMGDMEMIFPDGSGIEFNDEGVDLVFYDYCDGCNKSTKLQEILPANKDELWLCKACKAKVK